MKTLYTISFLVIFKFAVSQESFLIYGRVKNISPNKVFFAYQSLDGNIKIDSSEIVNDLFEISGAINCPTYATIWFTYTNSALFSPNSKRHYTNVFLEPGVMRLTREDKSSKLEGSLSNDLLETFSAKVKPITNRTDTLNTLKQRYLKNADSVNLGLVEDSLELADKELRAAYRSEYLLNPSSPIAVYLLNVYTYAGWEVDADDFDTLFSKLSPEAINTLQGRELEKKLHTYLISKIGAMAPEFTQNDTAGNAVSLTTYRGKYLLIDFWASWCGPCRIENPNYVSAYKKYNSKGFEILAVSLDKDKNAWIKAINDDKLNWVHVSDLKAWQNSVAQLYGVKAVPRNFLLDKSGKIIAKDLRGKELSLLLDQLMDK